MIYKIAICDDNKNYADYLEELIMDIHPGKSEIFKYRSADSFLADAGHLHNLVFLNVKMTETSRPQILKEFRRINLSAMLVVVTEKSLIPVNVIDALPSHYLMTHYDKTRVKNEIRLILEKLQRPLKEIALSVKSDNKVFQVMADDIAYISKLKHGSQVHVVKERRPDLEGVLSVKQHLKELHKLLHEIGFEYAHGSYLINCRWVEGMEDQKYVTLKGQINLSVSRSMQKIFAKALVEFWGSTREE